MSGQALTSTSKVPPERMLQWRAGQLSGQARWFTQRWSREHISFNGGPDNCPARHGSEGRFLQMGAVLQWRAGQLSGQAGQRLRKPSRNNRASMEGRTIVRPGATPRSVSVPLMSSLQWRAGQLSGQAGRNGLIAGPVSRLQWRAGQLSGQARRIDRELGYRRISFNGGPDNCPARLVRREGPPAPGHIASMEGRTIVRPGLLVPAPPDGAVGASMEGRTIVRPGKAVRGCAVTE